MNTLPRAMGLIVLSWTMGPKIANHGRNNLIRASTNATGRLSGQQLGTARWGEHTGWAYLRHDHEKASDRAAWD